MPSWPLSRARAIISVSRRSPCSMRAAERLLLAREPHVDGVTMLDQLRVGGAHLVADDVGVARQERALDADPAALVDRAAHELAQHVAALLVGRDDAIGDQEAHAARVVGEDAQCAVLRGGRELAAEVHQRHEEVGVEDAVDALLDQRLALEPEAGVDVLRGQRRQPALLVLVELHEDEVPVLQEALVVAARQVLLRPPLEPAVEVELRARPARADRPRLPEVLRAGQQHDALARDADRLPGGDRLLVGAEPETLVALVDGDPDVLGLEAESPLRLRSQANSTAPALK